MKVLLSAYACEPHRGSEEGVGWNIVTQVARQQEVWVLTRTFYRSVIEAELQKNPMPNLHFLYFDPFNWTSDWRDTQGAVQLHYYLWQVQAYFIARSLHRQIQFDLVQHVTYVKYWSPSFLSLLPAPFIWGPVGGGESAPRSFWKDFSLRGRIYEALRAAAQKLGELDPFTQLTARRSTLAIATTHETAKRVRYLGAFSTQVASQVALSKAEISALADVEPAPYGSARFISIGRLLHWKGFHLGLSAFALAQIPGAEYWIIGEGAERARLEALSQSLGISESVRFFGKLNRNELFNQLRLCHALIHPSLHDSGGQVCAEMMAAGRPVICLDLGGPAIQVTEETGIKVPAHTPEQTVKALAEAMTRLANDHDLRQSMGRAGQQRVKEMFNWDAIGHALNETYQEVIDKSLSPSR
ncbi:MAG: glycosyltransferase family 4 protein [Nostoc sp. C3-bin3]|nr:glycosyltransferase family 4 protein [Nostoc sp. C3-bin3]